MNSGAGKGIGDDDYSFLIYFVSLVMVIACCFSFVILHKFNKIKQTKGPEDRNICRKDYFQ